VAAAGEGGARFERRVLGPAEERQEVVDHDENA